MKPLPGQYYTLRVTSNTGNEVMLEEGVLLHSHKPIVAEIGDELTVYVYHAQNGQLCGTTSIAKGCVGEFVTLKVVAITEHGAFLDLGIPKDLFVPRSYHEEDLQVGDWCLVKILIDNQNGKLIGKERLEDELDNENLTVFEKEVYPMIVYKDTPLGYQVIIEGKHIGLLHFNEVFKDLFAGDTFTGFIKKIKPDGKIDVMIGEPGYKRTEQVKEPILDLLKSNNGFLPYHDKSDAEEIHRVFGMSKKTFKMTIGNLYKQRKIRIEKNGIYLS